MQPVRVQAATILCSTRAYYAGKLPYWYRAPHSAASESRTRRRLPHLIARQFNNLQVRHVSPLARVPWIEMSSQKFPSAGDSRARARARRCRSTARLHLGSLLTHLTRFPREIARRSRFATSIASLLFSIYIFNYVCPEHPSLTMQFAEMR